MVGYHTNRKHPYFSFLKPNQTIDLIRSDEIVRKYLKTKNEVDYLISTYPDGITPHGLLYLSAATPSCSYYNNSLIEAVFELVRHADFPTMPSRFTSLFMTSTLNTAKLWCNLFCKGIEYQVLKVQTAEASMTLDARYLETNNEYGFSLPEAYHNATCYWSGKQTSSPLFEVLGSLPATILAIE